MQYKWISSVSVGRTIVAPIKPVVSMNVIKPNAFWKFKYPSVFIQEGSSPTRFDDGQMKT